MIDNLAKVVPMARLQNCRFTSTGILLIACVLLGINIALIVQNRKLKQRVSAPTPELLPKIGLVVDHIDGAAIDGSKMRLTLANQPERTLLFVFSTRCGVCDLNWPTWAGIEQSIRGGHSVRVAYANIVPPLTDAYLKTHQIQDSNLLAQLDPHNQVELNLRLTPLTVLFNQNGKIERVWPGLLQGNQLSEIRHILESLRVSRAEEPISRTDK